MPRSRPGKKERALKRQNDEKALERLNDQIRNDRLKPATGLQSDSRVTKKPATDEHKFSNSEVQAIVQAAVTAAVQTTTSLLTGVEPKQQERQFAKPPADSTEKSKTRPLAERIQFPKKSLAERIVFPKKQ
jgi:hypothetical protein